MEPTRHLCQIEVRIRPLKWVLIPKIIKVTPDMFIIPGGNYVLIQFLFLYLKIVFN